MPAPALIAHAAELLAQVLRLEHPADAVVADYFKRQRQLGPRERARLAEAVFAVLRQRRRFEHLAGLAANDTTQTHNRHLALLALELG